MVASGVPVARHDHVIQLVELAHDMLGVVDAYNAEMGTTLELRIGISSGPMIAGVIGSKKLSYDIWGDTVNVASRMESTGIPGRIQVTERVAESLRERFLFESRGEIQIKGRGKMETFLVTGQFDVDIDALSDEVSEPQTDSH